MINCPLISYGKPYIAEVECMGEQCVLWNSNKDSCLIRLALLKYTHDIFSEEEKNIEDKIKVLENQIRMASLGFSTYPFETSGLNTAKYPPNNPIGGDTINSTWSNLQGGR